MERKGELSSTQLITIIILIISFAVIVIFIVNLSLKSETEKQSCRNSVVLRGTPGIGGNVKLDCKTQSVCISKGASCKEPSDVTIKVSGRTELLDKLTNLMYDCWWQMGEGKVNYLPSSLGGTRNYCAICDIVHFGDDLKADKTMNNIPVKDLYLYMRNKKVGDTDMLYAFYKMRDINALGAAISQTSRGFDMDRASYDFTRSEGYMLSTSMASKGWGTTIAMAVGGTIIVGVGIVLAVPTAGASLVAVGAVAGGGVFGGLGLWIDGPGGLPMNPPTYYVFNRDAIKSLECYEFSSLA